MYFHRGTGSRLMRCFLPSVGGAGSGREARVRAQPLQERGERRTGHWARGTDVNNNNGGGRQLLHRVGARRYVSTGPETAAADRTRLSSRRDIRSSAFDGWLAVVPQTASVYLCSVPVVAVPALSDSVCPCRSSIISTISLSSGTPWSLVSATPRHTSISRTVVLICSARRKNRLTPVEMADYGDAEDEVSTLHFDRTIWSFGGFFLSFVTRPHDQSWTLVDIRFEK